MAKGNSKIGSKSTSNSNVISDFEKSIYKSDNEQAMIITTDGEVIKFGGDENHVFGTKEDLQKMDGAIATHNHPNNTIFSTTDVSNGIATGNLAEMRIVTKEGETYTIKNVGNTVEQRRSFNANYYNQNMKANNNVDAKLRRGEKVDRNEYVRDFMDKWLSNHATDYGMSYEKGKIK